MTSLPSKSSLRHRRLRRVVTTLGLILGTVLAVRPSFADPVTTITTIPRPHAYGILVGTNVGGPGQRPLRYAEEDANRVAQVLKELGRYGTADLRVLHEPDPAKVFATIDEIAVKMREHQAKGEQAMLVFYYSGHAKANAFNLGDEELPVGALRERLRQVPSTLTLVVLDACQSGQFARTKGAEPAADFSYNSVSRLTTKGIAVIASSTARELSQESDQLRSSYFTHHLVVGLRGAADTDADGRVSLDEAYRYAYRRTLAATAQTRVGSQHVTLEMDLSGQGDLPVTYPADARSQLELPAPLDGRVVVQHRPSGSIVAEVQKAPGAALRLALAQGSYEALVRVAGPKFLRCKVGLTDERVTSLDLAGCETVSRASFPKGDAYDIADGSDERALARDVPASVASVAEPPRIEPWAFELGAGFMARRSDGFTRRLEEFAYRPKRGFFELPRGRLSVAVTRGLVPNVTLGVIGTMLGGDTYFRDVSSSKDEFVFREYGLGALARFSSSRMGSRTFGIVFYGQAMVGATYGSTTLSTGATSATASSGASAAETSSETFWGGMIGGAAGIDLGGRIGSLFLQTGYDYAPTISNLIGDTHDAGGFHAQLGLRIRFANR